MSKVLKEILAERESESEKVELDVEPSPLRLVTEPEAPAERARATASAHRSETFDRPIRELLRDRRRDLVRTEEEKAERRRERLEATLNRARRPTLVPVLAFLIAFAVAGLIYLRHRPISQSVPAGDPPANVAGIEAGLAEGNREAIALYREGKLHEAMKKVDYLIRRFPRHAELYVNSAMIRSRAKLYLSARKDLEVALAIDPKNATALNNLGALDLRQKLLIPATENLKAAVQLQPEYVAARLNYAKALELSGRYEDAIAQYQESSRRIANDPILSGLIRKRIQKLQEVR